MPSFDYDLLAIGGGQAGIPIVHALHGDGLRVALVERSQLGGTCVNYGCIPSKGFIACAERAHAVRTASGFGITTGEPEIDFRAVMDHARWLRDDARGGLEEDFEGDAPELIRGHARLAGRHGAGYAAEIELADGGTRRVTARRVVLDVGARSAKPEIDGLDDIAYLHSGNWLGSDERPEHLVIVGGGYIGVGLGQAYHRLGSRVTILNAEDQIISNDDKDVADALQGFLEDDGLTIRLETKPTSVCQSGSEIVVTSETGSGEPIETRATHLFIAAGRQPNTDDLGLGSIGVEPEDDGTLELDERLRVAVGGAAEGSGLYGAGDLRGGAQFTHTAWDDHRIVLRLIREELGIETPTLGAGETRERTIPYAVFTDPGLGRVGLTESAAREAGHDVRVACYAMKRNPRARAVKEPRGFVKVVADADTGVLLGAAVLARKAAELVHAYIPLVANGMTAEDYYRTLPIHPALGEGLHAALKDLL